jgi:hypothetical protein
MSIEDDRLQAARYRCLRQVDLDLAIATSRSWSIVAGRLRNLTSCVEILIVVVQQSTIK